MRRKMRSQELTDGGKVSKVRLLVLSWRHQVSRASWDGTSQPLLSGRWRGVDGHVKAYDPCTRRAAIRVDARPSSHRLL